MTLVRLHSFAPALSSTLKLAQTAARILIFLHQVSLQLHTVLQGSQ